MKTNVMQCVACLHKWDDLPGAFGERFDKGCPRCGCMYWTVDDLPTVTLDKVWVDGNGRVRESFVYRCKQTVQFDVPDETKP